MKITIVCGPPASGKTTYVKNNMHLGDFVVDLDAIRCAVAFTEKDHRTDNLVSAVIEIRDYIYSMITRGKIETQHCWIIACLPKKEDRDQMRRRFGANLISLEVSRTECMRRAMNDPERIDKERQIEIIEKYFNDSKPYREKNDRSAVIELAKYYKDLDD